MENQINHFHSMNITIRVIWLFVDFYNVINK